MTKTRMPGVVADPWRKAITAPVPSPRPALPLPTANVDTSGDTDDFGSKYTTIELKGYGGITVEGTQEVPTATLLLLNFCVQEKAAIDDLFAEYGVVVSQLPLLEPTSHLKFYIQRADGWTLAIPLARTRDAGALQLIQAFMALYSVPPLRDKLMKYKIKPYKI